MKKFSTERKIGISFKISKRGTRYGSALNKTEEKKNTGQQSDSGGGARQRGEEDELVGVRDNSVNPQDPDVSFSLNLFPDGFSIGKPDEGLLLPLLQGVPKQLHPYDRQSKMLFSAVEYGLLPGDILDDIPCKYIDGTVICEVRDYRDCMTKSVQTVNSEVKSPVVHKVSLKMCMENVVKDMSSISEDSWTYNDLLEVESRIIKFLQPELCLDPTPMLDKLCGSSISKKLNLGVFADKRKHDTTQAANIVSTKQPCRSGASNSEVLDNLNSQSFLTMRDRGVLCAQKAITTDFAKQHHNFVQENVAQESFVESELNCQAAVRQKSFLTATVMPSTFISSPEHDFTNSYSTGLSLSGKRDIIAAQLNAWPNTKRLKRDQLEIVQVQPELAGSQMETGVGHRINSQNTLLQQQQEVEIIPARFSSQFSANEGLQTTQAIILGDPRFLDRMSYYQDYRGMQYRVKQEPVENVMAYKSEMEKINTVDQVIDNQREQYNHLQSQVQRFSPYGRSHALCSVQCGQVVDKDPRKGSSRKKRRSTHVPRRSSQESSRSGVFSDIPVGTPCSTSATNVVGLQKEKATSTSCVAVNKVSENSSHASQKGNDTSVSAKRKLNSLSKTVSGVGSSSSWSNSNSPHNANDCCTGGPPPTLPVLSKAKDDDLVLQNFMKIATVTRRYGINSIRRNFDSILERKSSPPAPQLFGHKLSEFENTEDLRDAADEISLSKPLVGGNLNICKTRRLTFMCPRRVYQEGGLPMFFHEPLRLFMSEKPKDGTVEVHVQCGDEDEINYFPCFQYSMQPLPNTHYADLFAAQFSSLMAHEGNELVDDQIQPNQSHNSGPSSHQHPSFITSAMHWNGSGKIPQLTTITGQASQMQSPSSSSSSSSKSSSTALNPRQFPSPTALAGSPAIPPEYFKATLQLSDSSLSRPNQEDGAAYLISLNQQQLPRLQRSSMFTGHTSDPLGSSGTDLCNQMASDLSRLQFLYEQRQMLHHHSLMKNTMVGLGAAAGTRKLGAVRSGGGVLGFGSLVGLGVKSNIPGMGSSISEPMGGHIPGLGNVGRINNLSTKFSSSGILGQQLLSGGLSSAAQAAAVAELRLANGQGNGISFQGNSVDGMMGNNLGNGDLLLGQTISRAGTGQFQSAGMTSVGTSDTAFNANNQQQQHPQLRIQQMQLHQEDLNQTQQMCSPLQLPQAVSLPEQMGSPPNHSPQLSQQTQTSPQQTSEHIQVSPQKQDSELTKRQQVNTGSIMMDQGSPQLSSQKHGPMSSSASSPGGATKCVTKGKLYS